MWGHEEIEELYESCKVSPNLKGQEGERRELKTPVVFSKVTTRKQGTSGWD